MTRDELGLLEHEVRSPVAALSALAGSLSALDADERALLLPRVVPLARAAVEDITRLCGSGDPVGLGQLVPLQLGDAVEGVAGNAVAIEKQTAELWVMGDVTRLRQALRNVLDNAARHGTESSVAVTAVDEFAVIEIRDNGPGVPEGLDVFARGVSGAGSSGYGLWVARSIVDAHGGTLELVRDGASGACFRIALPLASASA